MINQAKQRNAYIKRVKWNEYKNMMIEHNVDEWLIEVFENIGFMSSRSQCYECVKSALVLAWYKLNYLEEFEEVVGEVYW